MAAWSLAVRFSRRSRVLAEKANAATHRSICARLRLPQRRRPGDGQRPALPERIDKDTAERVAGRHFCSTDFDALATQTPGFISREQLLEAARVRNLSFTLREKSQKKFDFGFVAEEKEGGAQ